MNRNSRFDDNDDMTDAEKRVSENAASEFTALLKTEQADRSQQSQDFGERLTSYTPASRIKKKK